VSYNPRGRDDARLVAAQHSPDVDWEGLTNTSPYKFYLRTRDENDELTHSYKVEAFPPAADVRADVTGEPGMTDAELAALKRRSVGRYGTVPEGPEEQKAQSHFYGDGPGDAGDEDGDLADAHGPIVRRVRALEGTPAPDVIDDLLAEPGDLWRRVGTDMTVPAPAVGDGSEDRASDDDGDTDADAVEDAEAVTVDEAHEIATDSGDPEFDVFRRTVRNWVGALVEADAVEKIPGDHAADPDTYRPR